MTSQKQWDIIRKDRCCIKLKITKGQWAYIKRIGTILENLYTASCNGEGKDGLGYPKLETKYERIAAKFAQDNQLHIHFQTDPRGACIYLDVKEIPENNYTNAICVY